MSATKNRCLMWLHKPARVQSCLLLTSRIHVVQKPLASWPALFHQHFPAHNTRQAPNTSEECRDTAAVHTKMAPQARVRFYREFLTPALHRRFTRAAGLALLLCYVEAIAVGDKSSCKNCIGRTLQGLTDCRSVLWSWFPIGPAGIRTLLLFMSSLSIFVLRVAQLHFGSRTTPSSFETFRQYAFRFNTLQTLGFYFFSAWWFGEVYMFSVPHSADLSWVVEGKYV